MKNIENLRDDLYEVFNKLSDDNIEPTVATAMSSVAGKIINSSRVQLMYNTQKEISPKMPNIKFLIEK